MFKLVEMFRTNLRDILKKENPKIYKIYKWTDGCASQYKGKTSFAYISQDSIDIRNFFETSHGKSVCDGLGAPVKSACHQGVISGKAIIGNGQDLFTYCEKRLKVTDKVNTRREFVYVDSENIIKNRSECRVQTLLGTRKLHAIRNVRTPYQLQVRNPSCFCQGCCSGNEDCENLGYVSHWENKTLKAVKTRILFMHVYVHMLLPPYI